jgi:hypothetical protein
VQAVWVEEINFGDVWQSWQFWHLIVPATKLLNSTTLAQRKNFPQMHTDWSLPGLAGRYMLPPVRLSLDNG